MGSLLMGRKMGLESFDFQMGNFIEENLSKTNDVGYKVSAFIQTEQYMLVNGKMISSTA